MAQNSGRCEDFDYSDDEKEEDGDEVVPAKEDNIAVEENAKLKTKQQTARSSLGEEGEVDNTEIIIPASRDEAQSQSVLDETKSSDPVCNILVLRATIQHISVHDFGCLSYANSASDLPVFGVLLF